MSEKRRNIAVLGSTGSIGTQALDVVRKNPEHFEVYALTANNNVDLLIEQALEFQPEVVAIGNEEHYNYVKEALASKAIKVFAGSDSIAQIAEMEPIDTVLTAMVGYSGLLPTIHAVKAGKTIALANKETLVVAGDIINELAQKHQAPIIPVDSEHSAIFQCLAGEGDNPIERIILTASGGPFRKHSDEQMLHVKSADALKHPVWEMGAKITIDSATMINKGFEVIEAKWLFGLRPEQIEVVVHPQSIIHSIVEFTDSSMKAQMGMPDMRLPIQYAFTYPNRLKTDFPRLDLLEHNTLTFEIPDTTRFRNLALSYEAMEKGGNMPCILNAANEVVVEAFLQDKIGFLQMSDIIESVMQKATFIEKPSYEDYVMSNEEARQFTLREME